MRNTRDELFYLQDQKDKRQFWTVRTHVRTFLIITSVLSGCLIGLLTSNSKLFTESIKMSHTIPAMIINPYIYFFGGMMIILMSSAFYNLNLTMSLYSQLFVLPFYESCSICFNLASGLLIMGEF
jgi:hypothetical protein